MFSNNGFFAFHPFSDMRDEFPLMGRGPGDVVDKWMEILEPWSTGVFVDDPSPWSRPPTRCCPHACVLDRPQRPSRRVPSSLQHFVILPSLLSQPTCSDQEGGDQKNERDAGCSQQCQGKDTASRQQTPSAATSKDASGSNNSSGQTPEKSPWQFSVDMKGCDEVRAMTEKGMLMVEGRGSSDNSKQMVRYVTSLPRHVNHDSLTASLNNGRLTVTQKGEAQLEGQARTLPIGTQQKETSESMKQQKQTSEVKEQVQGAERSRNVAAA